jgi:GNAT superfamily N-acetyltransferase
VPSIDAEPLNVVPLSSSDHLLDIDCGEAAQNTWLSTRALQSHRSDDSRTYLAYLGPQLAGFYALSTSSMLRAALPGPLRRNAPDPVSAVLLAQLAVASAHQGRGISRELLLHAMAQTLKISDLAGCRLFIVHPAGSELTSYYAKANFTLLPGSPTLTMAMSLQTLRATLAAAAAKAKKA